jgi:hypothetical protein
MMLLQKCAQTLSEEQHRIFLGFKSQEQINLGYTDAPFFSPASVSPQLQLWISGQMSLSPSPWKPSCSRERGSILSLPTLSEI